MQDVSPEFKQNKKDSRVIQKILKHEGTPEAIRVFDRNKKLLTDYAYWFFLSTLWVQYNGHIDLSFWKRLFKSNRPKRKECIMKPSEIDVYDNVLPRKFFAYRAHRENETDWVSYSIRPEEAAKFAVRRGVSQVKKYEIHKKDVLALFLRRNEFEIIVLNKRKVKYIETLAVEKKVKNEG